MSLSIGVIGSGAVGRTLAAGFSKHGHSVTIGSRTPSKLQAWQAESAPNVTLADVETTAKADVIVIAVAGTAAAEAVTLAGAALDGKVVIDAANPIDGPPDHGVVAFFTGPSDSLMERLQRQAPAARFVKAFNSVGAHLMIDPALGDRPTMFICGNDDAAKATVTALLADVGWDAEDVGGVEAARAIEPLCQLWCARGFKSGKWAHAFKLVQR
jgi:predicted dinucleotide-binding enzyme